MVSKSRIAALALLLAPLVAHANNGVYFANPGIGSIQFSDVAVRANCTGSLYRWTDVDPSSGLFYCPDQLHLWAKWTFPPRGRNNNADKVWEFILDGSDNAHCGDDEAVIYHLREWAQSGRIEVNMLDYCEPVGESD